MMQEHEMMAKHAMECLTYISEHLTPEQKKVITASALSFALKVTQAKMDFLKEMQKAFA